MAPPPGRTRIVSERTNFPTDLYIAETIARDRGMELVLVDDSELAARSLTIGWRS